MGKVGEEVCWHNLLPMQKGPSPSSSGGQNVPREGGFLVEDFKIPCYCKENLGKSFLKLPWLTLEETGRGVKGLVCMDSRAGDSRACSQS